MKAPPAKPPESPAPDEPNGQRGHTLADHRYGADIAHSHDDGDSPDHDHDDFGAAGPLEENPIWMQDHVTLMSVGMDIGSSGTQVIFSRVVLRRMGESLSSRYYVVARETLHQSPVSLTPYNSETLIDEAALADIIDRAYEEAGLSPDEIDAGAVILTGEALRRENAQAIAEILSQQGGEFVCATAGHHMEAMLAAYGSGAARASSEAGTRILNIDIGGGTTKLALVERGRVLATAAVHIGGRLQVVDGDGRIVRLDPAGRYLAAEAGLAWTVGDTAAPGDMARVAEWMADALVAAIRDRAPPHAVEQLFLTAPLPEPGAIDGIMFSGGVAEYVYRRETRDFGDMGRLLGEALARRVERGAFPWPLLPPGECIRATAVGASEYSVQLSGNTTYISDPGRLLPRRNLQVLRPPYECGERILPDELARCIHAHFTAFDLAEGEAEVALAFHWQGAPSYERLSGFARGIVAGLPRTLAAGKPIYLVLDGDVAQTLGALLREELHVASEVLVIDGVVLWDFDYVDLGRIRMPSHTVPVTVKSLVFREDPHRPNDPAAHGHGHDHYHAHDDGHEHSHAHGHHHHDE